MSFQAPLWLLLLIPLGLSAWLIWCSDGRAGRLLPGAWHQVIAPELRPAMSRRVLGAGRSDLPLYAAILTLIVLALSRPVIGKPDLPDYGNLMGRVLVLDMSGEVAIDEQRLIAEQMVRDAPDILTGLVAVASEAFDVVPLTTDTAFLLRYLRVLNADMMPQTGRALALGVIRAERALTQAGVAAGQVVLMSGGTAPDGGMNPPVSTVSRHLVLAQGNPKDWSGFADALSLEIASKEDTSELAETLRADAHSKLAVSPAQGVFRLTPVCLLLAAVIWLLLFRRKDRA